MAGAELVADGCDVKTTVAGSVADDVAPPAPAVTVGVACAVATAVAVRTPAELVPVGEGSAVSEGAAVSEGTPGG